MQRSELAMFGEGKQRRNKRVNRLTFFLSPLIEAGDDIPLFDKVTF